MRFRSASSGYRRGRRSVDLALCADELAARAATLAAKLERASCWFRPDAIEREAGRALAGARAPAWSLVEGRLAAAQEELSAA